MRRPDLARLSLNAITTKKWTLAQAIEGCARHGIRGITVWRDRLQEMGVAAAVKSLKAHGLAVTGLCRGGMFPAVDAAGRKVESHEASGSLSLGLSRDFPIDKPTIPDGAVLRFLGPAERQKGLAVLRRLSRLELPRRWNGQDRGRSLCGGRRACRPDHGA